MIETINAFTALFSAPVYLEIGVSRGVTFDAVAAARKIAVDPAFAFDIEDGRRRNPNAHYRQMTSDAFFANPSIPLIDVAYIDGLHTLEQTLRDLLNTLSLTKPSSVVIIDDVRPSSFAASISDKAKMHAFRAAMGDADEAWMGDVFRLVYFIESFLQAYTFASPIGGNPQLVLWREVRAAVPERTLTSIGAMEFCDFVLDFQALRPAPLEDIVARARKAGVGDRPAA